MEKVQIRPLVKEDSKALYEVFLNPTFHFMCQDEIAYPQNNSFYENLIETAELSFALEFNGKLVASILLQKENEVLKLNYLYVMREFRGNSYAKDLVQEVLKESKNAPISAITLDGQREHERLLSELGFSRTAKTKKAEFEGSSYIFHFWLST